MRLKKPKVLTPLLLFVAEPKIGFGAPTKEDSSSSHGAPLGDEEIAGARKNLKLAPCAI